MALHIGNAQKTRSEGERRGGGLDEELILLGEMSESEE